MPHLTRISKIKGFNNVLAGRDLEGVFKEGHVYGIKVISDTIIVTDLGEYADDEKREYSPLSHIIMYGDYLLTKEEGELQKKYKDRSSE